MALIAVVVLHESGLPIYKKFLKGKERPMEPLVAAILGLSKEVGLGDIAHAKFERASIIVLRGIDERKLLLSLLVRQVNHRCYIWGMYLLSKIEKSLGKLPDFVTDDMINATKEIVDKYFDKLPKLPDFLGEAFMYATERFGPMFYGSLLILLYRKFSEDPLIAFVRDPKRFISVLDKILGEDSATQLMMYMLEYICKTYPNVCNMLGIQNYRVMVKKILGAARKRSKSEVVRRFRDGIERIIDVFMS